MIKLKTLDQEIPKANIVLFNLNKYETVWEKVKKHPSYQKKIENTKKLEELYAQKDQQRIALANIYIIDSMFQKSTTYSYD